MPAKVLLLIFCCWCSGIETSASSDLTTSKGIQAELKLPAGNTILHSSSSPEILVPAAPIRVGLTGGFSIWIPVRNASAATHTISVTSEGLPLQSDLLDGELGIYLNNSTALKTSDVGIHEVQLTLKDASGTITSASLRIQVEENCQNRYWFRDADDDGFGTSFITQSICTQPQGFVENALDCDDSQSAIHPRAAEVPGDGIDNNCDYAVDEPLSNRAPVFSFSSQQITDALKPLTLHIQAIDPDANDQLTITLESVVLYSSTEPNHEVGATFSTAMPHTARGTAATTMHWTPGREHVGYVDFTFAAEDEHGNKTTESYIFFIDLPLSIYPIPPLQLAANQPFDLQLQIENADFHEIYDNSLGHEVDYPAWLEVQVGREASGCGNCIRLRGTPGNADLGEYSLDIFIRAIFGKEATTNVKLRVVKGKNKTWYPDGDGDGFGVAGHSLPAVVAPQGYADNALDCNDADASRHPAAAEQAGDGIDNNCNGQVDEIPLGLASKPLSISSSCSDLPQQRRWRINNPNARAVSVQWWNANKTQTGKLDVPPGEFYFNTLAKGKGADQIFISWQDGRKQPIKRSAVYTKNTCGTKSPKGAKKQAAPLSSTSTLEAYPMPFANQLRLRHHSIATHSAVKVILQAIDGKQFAIGAADLLVGEEEVELKLANVAVPAGFYVLKLWVDEQEPVYLKVIKKDF